MVIIPPHQTAVSLFHKSGSVRLFASIKEAKKELGIRWIADNVGTHFREYAHTRHKLSHCEQDAAYPADRLYEEKGYIMRNDVGEPVTYADFHALKEPRRLEVWLRRYHWNGVGPVPCVRKWRGGQHYCRRFKTTRSRRQSYAIFEDGEVAPRPRQNANGIPNTWDDHGVAARRDRSWKRYRKTQYKT